ncbi:MAG: sugar phosphate nucleotidyltransferase, partial [bacterium]
GIYFFNRRVLEFIPQNKHLDLPDLVKTLIRKRERVQAYRFRGEWLDIGRPEDYEIAQRDYARFVGGKRR